VRKAGIQANAGHHHSYTVGSHDTQQVRLRGGEHLLLKLEPLFAQFSETRRYDDGSLGTACPELADQGRNLIGRCGDDGEIGCLGQARHVWMDWQPIQAGMPRVDQIQPPLKVASPQVLSGDGAHRARTRRSSDQSDRAGSEYLVQVASRHSWRTIATGAGGALTQVNGSSR
jgi:hypothetical protein